VRIDGEGRSVSVRVERRREETAADALELCETSRVRRIGNRAPRGRAGYARGVVRARLLIFASRILSVMSTECILLRERGAVGGMR